MENGYDHGGIERNSVEVYGTKNNMHDKEIRIGALVKGGDKTADYIRQILPYGFASFSISLFTTMGAVI